MARVYRAAMISMLLLVALACSPDRPIVVVDDDRSAHFWNRPFPSDEMLDADGTVSFEGFPAAERMDGGCCPELLARGDRALDVTMRPHCLVSAGCAGAYGRAVLSGTACARVFPDRNLILS